MALLARTPLWAVSLILGALAALAHPPFGFLPGLLAYGGLMLVVEQAKTLRGAFLGGWLAGLVYFTIGCWWVAEAFLVDAATFGWMAPIAVAALAGGLALFWGFGCAVYRRLLVAGPLRVLVFAGSLSLLEYLRGNLFTGFPWNLPGTTWAAGSAMSQTAGLVGAYGLTWVTLAICAAPAVLAGGWRDRKNQIAAGIAAAALAGLWAWGAVVLSAPSRTTALAVRIVQPNHAQLPHYTDAINLAQLRDYAALTVKNRPGAGPGLVIWPEGAMSWAEVYLAPGSPGRAIVTGALRPGDILLIGAIRTEDLSVEARAFNTLVALRRTATDVQVIGVYDKHRLVPFGEYLPMKPLLHAIGFQSLVPVADGFSQGPEPRALDLGALKIQPLICYESLFPGFTGHGARAGGGRAGAIVNLSTDAWFGATSGPLQHLNQAAYRAIEEGLPLLRATPTGVSAVIDPRGRLLARRNLGEAGVIDAFVPAPNGPTPYSRWGDGLFLVMLAATGLIWVRNMVALAKKP